MFPFCSCRLTEICRLRELRQGELLASEQQTTLQDQLKCISAQYEADRKAWEKERKVSSAGPTASVVLVNCCAYCRASLKSLCLFSLLLCFSGVQKLQIALEASAAEQSEIEHETNARISKLVQDLEVARIQGEGAEEKAQSLAHELERLKASKQRNEHLMNTECKISTRATPHVNPLNDVWCCEGCSCEGCSCVPADFSLDGSSFIHAFHLSRPPDERQIQDLQSRLQEKEKALRSCSKSLAEVKQQCECTLFRLADAQKDDVLFVVQPEALFLEASWAWPLLVHLC